MATTLPRLSPRLVTTREAADLLNVSQRTVLNWIERDAIPYVQLPTMGKRREYRIPLAALLRSLSGNFDLAEALRVVDAKASAANVTDEAVVELLDEM